jgi:hypothetical protein
MQRLYRKNPIFGDKNNKIKYKFEAVFRINRLNRKYTKKSFFAIHFLFAGEARVARAGLIDSIFL